MFSLLLTTSGIPSLADAKLFQGSRCGPLSCTFVQTDLMRLCVLKTHFACILDGIIDRYRTLSCRYFRRLKTERDLSEAIGHLHFRRGISDCRHRESIVRRVHCINTSTMVAGATARQMPRSPLGIHTVVRVEAMKQRTYLTRQESDSIFTIRLSALLR